MDMDYDVNTTAPIEWRENNDKCVLCEYADDTGGALAHLKQMDT